MTRDPALPPDPAGGWSTSCRDIRNALIVPPQRAEPVQPAGICDGDDRYVPRGAVWRRDRAITTAPTPPQGQIGQLRGRWLWAGLLYGHFGHFLVESTARLWAVPAQRDALDGVVFAQRNPGHGAELQPFQIALLRQLIGDLPVKVVTGPTRVEQLAVPGQGFGLGAIAQGTRPFRRFADTCFGSGIVASGPERLFISRALQGPKQGGFVGEHLLDRRMEHAGYEVFHPERHDIATQIARYKAARDVVALDGSALHLFAMVARAPQRAAVILRRNAGASRGLIRHMASFMRADPLLLNAFRGEEKVVGNKALITDLDLEKIGRKLKIAGFLPKALHWPGLTPEELAQFNQDLERASRSAGKRENG